MGVENVSSARGKNHTGLLTYLIESLKSISVDSTIGGAAGELAVTEVAGTDSIWDVKALYGLMQGANLPRQGHIAN